MRARVRGFGRARATGGGGAGRQVTAPTALARASLYARRAWCGMSIDMATPLRYRGEVGWLGGAGAIRHQVTSPILSGRRLGRYCGVEYVNSPRPRRWRRRRLAVHAHEGRSIRSVFTQVNGGRWTFPGPWKLTKFLFRWPAGFLAPVWAARSRELLAV
jgi:hypothetical protein